MNNRGLNGTRNRNAERRLLSADRISIEREFSLFRQGMPLGRAETLRFKDRIEREADIHGGSAVDTEVAVNTLEVKLSLIDRRDYALRLSRLRREIEWMAEEEGLQICWTNQPRHNASEHNDYFTTVAFPGIIDSLIHANSLHMHLEVSPEHAINLYLQLNQLAPQIIRQSIERSGNTMRYDILAASVREFGEMALPQDIASFYDYQQYLEQASEQLEQRMRREGTFARAVVQFPHMFQDGRLVLTADKLFHPARLRPDLELPNGNISVEFRAIDGIGDLSHEIELVGAVLDYCERFIGSEPVNPSMTDVRRYLTTGNGDSSTRASGFMQTEVSENGFRRACYSC